MGNLSTRVRTLLSAVVLLAGLTGCTSPGTDSSPSIPPETAPAPEPSPNPMATLNGLSVYVASTGVQILDQSLVTGSRGYDVTVPDGVAQIGFAVMCESASQNWTDSAADTELSWTSPAECAAKAVYSDIIDVTGLSTVPVQVGLDGDTFLALVMYVATP